MVFVFSLFFQQVRGQSALTAGLMFLPMTGLIAVVNVCRGQASPTGTGPRPPMIGGPVLAVLGLLALLLPSTRARPRSALAFLMVPLGLGGALTSHR